MRVPIAMLALAGCGSSGVDSLSRADGGPLEAGARTDAAMDAGPCAAAAEWCGDPANCCTGLGCVQSGQGMVCSRDAGAVGEACQSDEQCNFRCATGTLFPGGYCSQPINECAAGSPPDGGDYNCPSGSICANGTIGISIGAPDLCLKRCDTAQDCRANEGYRCCRYHDSRVCTPVDMAPCL